MASIEYREPPPQGGLGRRLSTFFYRRPRVGLGEAGLQISIWIAMAIGFEHQRARSGSIIHDAAARVFGGLALLGILIALMFRENPLLTGTPVGGPGCVATSQMSAPVFLS